MSNKISRFSKKRAMVDLPTPFITVPRPMKRLLPVRTGKGKIGRKNPLRSIRIVNQKTVEIIFRDNIEIDVDGMKIAQNVIMKVTGRKRVKKLVVLGKDTSFTTEAGHFIVENNILTKQYTVAEALVVHSIQQLMASSFYFLYLRDNFPHQFFLEIERAKEWLREPGEENNILLKCVPIEEN
jgi:ethanolamine utilization protein EutP (predicted NTPase)